jgi:dienelactone hydrolase
MKSFSQQESPAQSYARFILGAARGGSGPVAAPATLSGWDDRLIRVRAGLNRSFGRMPEFACPLEPEVLGTLSRRGYAIERLTFQSRPGFRVTANLYRPDPVTDRLPAVLSVHGHWAWARMDPHVQPRCIGLARLGYAVLCVDAFGAGERAIEPSAGSYHGALSGASLWPIGTPLLGMQVYDNRRAVDYLLSRPDIDPQRLAITGASGGGNQTLYAGATDERLAAVVPVCGIGTYEAYLGTACCVCEVNVSGATYATTGDLLAMIAPRALLVISASRDAVQFSVGEAAKSVAYARERFRLLGQEAKVRHRAVESDHTYSRTMREAMYGWLEKWLQNRGTGDPIAEPELAIEEVDALRCFAAGSPRPQSIVTIPEWARVQGAARLAALPKPPDHVEHWHAEAERMRSRLRDQILGGFPARRPLDARLTGPADRVVVSITTERDVRSSGLLVSTHNSNQGTVILVCSEDDQRPDHDGRMLADVAKIRQSWLDAGFNVLQTSCRILPEIAPVAGVRDHTVAEWGVWIGRPLLGQWVWDIIRWLDFLDEARSAGTSSHLSTLGSARPYLLVGVGTFSLPTLLAAGLDSRVSAISCTNGLVSFVGETAKPYSGVPMGMLVPNVLDIGDIGHLAALIAPRPLVYAEALEPDGMASTLDRTRSLFGFSRSVYELLKAPGRLYFTLPANRRELLTKG